MAHMAVNATLSSDSDVMASVDHAPCGAEFVIADLECDDAWLSVAATEAPGLEEWR